VACDQTLAIYKAMNQLGGRRGIGNHEFNWLALQVPAA
jgi:hypothetical protein